MRITERGYEIYPQIIARNDTLHVAWFQIAGDNLVSYMRSIDGGETWGGVIDLVEDNHRGVWPDLTLNGGRAMIGWFDVEPVYPNDQLPNIAFSISNRGDEWSMPEYVYDSEFEGPFITATTLSSDTIYVVYHARWSDSTGTKPIIFLYSPDLGASWSDPYTLGHAIIYLNSLIIAECGGSLFTVWTSVPVPESTTFEAIVRVSHDGGFDWDDKIILSENGGRPAQRACLACNRATGELAVGWMDYNYPGDLYIRITSDGGYTWEPQLHVTDHHAIASPDIEFVGDTLWAVWDDRSISRNPELGFRKSVDRGQSWGPIERLTYAEGSSFDPWLSYDNGKLHLVWDDSRPPHGASEIYYKRWEADVGIDEGNKPKVSSLLTVYPNPFNSTTVMAYTDLEGGDIEIYNIAGQLVKELRVRGSQEGKITWDATDAAGEKVSSGIYFARATGIAGAQTIKLVYLK